MKKAFLFALIILIIPFASAGTMELSSDQTKIILSITENSIDLAAGRIFMSISENLVIYSPSGAGFFNNTYSIKGNNSNLEFQFFDAEANKKDGTLEIPFSGEPGDYNVIIERIELYNRSDYLIPFNQPIQKTINILSLPPEESISAPSAGGTTSGGSEPKKIGTSSDKAVYTPEQTVSGGEGRKKISGEIIPPNETMQNEEIKIPPIVPIVSGGSLLWLLIWLLYKVAKHDDKK